LGEICYAKVWESSLPDDSTEREKPKGGVRKHEEKGAWVKKSLQTTKKSNHSDFDVTGGPSKSLLGDQDGERKLNSYR